MFNVTHMFLMAVVSFVLFPLIAISGTVNLPETGQTTCYDSGGNIIDCTGTGQDGDTLAGIAWPVPRFTDNSDGTITDNLTRLMWAQNANFPGVAKQWYDALDYVAGMNAGTNPNLGYTDWRLPNINELESLENAGEANSDIWLSSQGFINVRPLIYWSSSSYAGNWARAWVIALLNGNTGTINWSYYHYVWPVRSGSSGSFGNSNIWKTGQTTCYGPYPWYNIIDCTGTGQDGDTLAGATWPSPRFMDNGNNTITDNLTGLVWAQNANFAGVPKIWQEALDYVAGMNEGTNPNLGYTDWRLPNRKELFSLIDYSQYPTTLQTGHPFVNVQDIYWSSSSLASNPIHAWCIYMAPVGFINAGAVSFASKDYTVFYVWPVRASPGTVPDTDNDGDGFSSAEDCDDNDDTAYPGAPELCDERDNDCNGIVDDIMNTFWADGDGDGYGDPAFPTDLIACTTPVGYSDNSDDCDDADATVYSGAPELCDGKDNDCDSIVPANEIDDDGDGFSECEGDCDDTDASMYPGASEIPDNGIDEDCNGSDLIWSDEIGTIVTALTSLDPLLFDKRNSLRQLLQVLDRALTNIEAGRYRSANRDLNTLLGYVDGCALTGSPDRNDKIIDCTAQAQIYDLVQEAIALLP